MEAANEDVVKVAGASLEEVLGRAMRSPVRTAAHGVVGRPAEVDHMAAAAAAAAVVVAPVRAIAVDGAVAVAVAAAVAAVDTAQAMGPAWAEEATLRKTWSNVAGAGRDEESQVRVVLVGGEEARGGDLLHCGGGFRLSRVACLTTRRSRNLRCIVVSGMVCARRRSEREAIEVVDGVCGGWFFLLYWLAVHVVV